MKKAVYSILGLFLVFSCSQTKVENAVTVNNHVTEAPKNIPEKITFPSLDGLTITANLYHLNDSAPVIVLCHQANFCKAEYAGIAKTLMEKGFNCLAIDQRSGRGLVEEFNETWLEAVKQKKPTDFLDAEQDIVAAVNFAAKKYGKKIILWGSSYSSTLDLFIAMANDNIKAVISFSPGDYFIKEKGSLTKMLATFSKPMFVTSSKEEAKELTAMVSGMKMNESQTQFIPEAAGFHGSRALWKTSENNEEYWKAIETFLEKIK